MGPVEYQLTSVGPQMASDSTLSAVGRVNQPWVWCLASGNVNVGCVGVSHPSYHSSKPHFVGQEIPVAIGGQEPKECRHSGGNGRRKFPCPSMWCMDDKQKRPKGSPNNPTCPYFRNSAKPKVKDHKQTVCATKPLAHPRTHEERLRHLSSNEGEEENRFRPQKQWIERGVVNERKET